MPDVEEVVGGSMRMEGYEELVEAFARRHIAERLRVLYWSEEVSSWWGVGRDVQC